MITSHYPNVSINTANPLTEQARRDNSRLDLFTPVKHAEKSATEKPVTTDEKSRNGSNNQNNGVTATEKDTETYQAIRARPEQNSEQESNEKQQQRQEKQAEDVELKQVQQLKARDTEVKTHEQAHASIGGSHAAAPTFSYQQGPDGKRYAIGGEVQIDVAPVANDAKATIAKMQQVQSAALAPAQPSSADIAIAAKAAQQAQQARSELNVENPANVESKMQKRRDVISGFYFQATLPQQQNLAQTV